MKQKILFLCTGNSCRSQMAEAWTRYLKNDIFEPCSAGVNPGIMDLKAVKVMAEAGIDISTYKAKNVNAFGELEFDYVITVCDHANENCPYFPGKTRRLHVGFDDPPRLSSGMDDESALEIYRRVRDEIQNFVQNMPGNLPV